LEEEARKSAVWPTPLTTDSKNNGGAGQRARNTAQLNCAVLGESTTWPTPLSSPWKGASGRSLKGEEVDLPQAVRTYMTPTVKTATGQQYTYDAGDHTKPRLALCGQIQVMEETGTCLETGRNKLNPDWVEWLMGWPIGYTALDPLPRTGPTWRRRKVWWRATRNSRWWAQDPANDPQTSQQIPRVVTSIPHRIPRLKCIGNGQVPLVAAVAWLTLVNLLEGD